MGNWRRRAGRLADGAFAMTDLQPTTTATGGRSAKVAALAALVVLVGVVYVGATGSSASAPAATGTPAPSFAVAAASAATPPVDAPRGRTNWGGDPRHRPFEATAIPVPGHGPWNRRRGIHRPDDGAQTRLLQRWFSNQASHGCAQRDADAELDAGDGFARIARANRPLARAIDDASCGHERS